MSTVAQIPVLDPEKHEYRLDGRVIPGVTSVLQSVGIIDTRWFTEYAAWRGSVVHRCCELDDLNDLHEPDVEPEASGYLAAYRRFKVEMQFAPDMIEQPMVLPDGSCAGTPDRAGTIARGQRITLDLKTGAIARWVKLQLAPYSEMTGYLGRVGVALRPDGTYAIEMFPMAERRYDLQVFRSALAVHTWKGINL